jgi:urate oxidase
LLVRCLVFWGNNRPIDKTVKPKQKTSILANLFTTVQFFENKVRTLQTQAKKKKKKKKHRRHQFTNFFLLLSLLSLSPSTLLSSTTLSPLLSSTLLYSTLLYSTLLYCTVAIMATLSWDRYGKVNVRLVKVKRAFDKHYISELTVGMLLEGDLARSFLTGDNSNTVPTDTIKNTVYVLAKKFDVNPIETFGIHLVEHFLNKYSHMDKAQATVTQHNWERLVDPDTKQEHKYAFRKVNPEVRCATVNLVRGGKPQVESQIMGLEVLKTTGSGFVGFPKCEYTTLPETEDRLLCTSVQAEWTYNSIDGVDFNAVHRTVRDSILDKFANKYSKSVQQTIYDVGEDVIKQVDRVETVTLHMPNIHNFEFDLARFGIKNDNEVFYPLADPSGFIEGTISRIRARL